MIDGVAADRVGFLDQLLPAFYNADQWAPGAQPT